jgi:hypothetical protein
MFEDCMHLNKSENYPEEWYATSQDTALGKRDSKWSVEEPGLATEQGFLM